MLTLGIDIGSLTAKAVLLENNKLIASRIMKVKATALKSADAVLYEVLKSAEKKLEDIDYTCSTGYGRYDIPFSDMNKSEISCHGMGAFWTNPDVRSIIDIGGQDCKVISVNEEGMVLDFLMNEKCAAGTGRSLEILSETIGISLEDLGKLSLKSNKKLKISNKCSIFMELDVLQFLFNKKNKRDIAYSINNAVTERVTRLAKHLQLREKFCITGGVSKNIGIVKLIENELNIKFTPLKYDAQLMGAIGASVIASKHFSENV
jgi:predicted CoA-substrate-specific enzyme activase